MLVPMGRHPPLEAETSHFSSFSTRNTDRDLTELHRWEVGQQGVTPPHEPSKFVILNLSFFKNKIK